MTIAALPISMIHQVYFIRTGPFIEAAGYKSVYIGPIMSIGQIAEIIMLAILGLFLKRLGFKLVLALGCVAYFVRFALFALADGGTKELILLSCVLHGLCYGFFFAGAYIYLERIVPKDARHSAQTLFGVVILGAGPVLAGFYNAWLGSIGKENTTGVQDWALIWWVQGFIGLACAVLVLAAFKQGVFRDESTEEIASVPADAAEEIP